jgi:hypothetical protein
VVYIPFLISLPVVELIPAFRSYSSLDEEISNVAASAFTQTICVVGGGSVGNTNGRTHISEAEFMGLTYYQHMYVKVEEDLPIAVIRLHLETFRSRR